MQRREAPPSRSAFTLIELLVVIAIIAVLMGLLTAAVMRFYGKGAEMQAQNDVARMSDAIGTFKTEFNVDYVPSRFVLRERYDATTLQNATGLERASLNYLATMFGSRFNPIGPHDWTGRYGGPQNVPPGATATAPIILDGQECLVFFLGGVPIVQGGNTAQERVIGVSGFSSSPSSPTSLGGTRKGPFFDFKTSRLKGGSSNAGPGSSAGRIPVYLDPFENDVPQPYAFFSASKGGYNQWGSSDCATLGLTNGAYVRLVNNNLPQFYHDRGFQIICAGPDGRFGPGGLLPPGSPANDQDTKDNFTNFARLRLGAENWE